MGLVTTKEMFEKAYNGGYAIGAFNVNNMEIVQGIMEAATKNNAPVILQVSAGARKYANPVYLKKLVESAIECNKKMELIFQLYFIWITGLILKLVKIVLIVALHQL